MARKQYKITKPLQCEKCEKADKCEFLQQLSKPPYDGMGILLDCKAFYYVFCDLENEVKSLAEKRKTINEEEIGEEELEVRLDNIPFLESALVTNGMLAAELALKYLIFIEYGTFDCIHYIDDLFEQLPSLHKKNMTNILKEELHQNDETLKINLEQIRSSFEDWRYFFQFENVGYTGFMNGFIHIVCDYAIEWSKNNKES